MRAYETETQYLKKLKERFCGILKSTEELFCKEGKLGDYYFIKKKEICPQKPRYDIYVSNGINWVHVETFDPYKTWRK